MNGKLKKIKDSSGYILPITHLKAVIGDDGRNLDELLVEIKEGENQVIESHSHANKLVLDQIGYDGSSLIYNGVPVGNVSNSDSSYTYVAPLSTEIINEFDIQNLRVSDNQISNLYFPVESYNSGSKAVVHPSVLYFENKWNGYHYWMGINPYAGINFENPAIFVSNDGINWKAPEGIVNPIDGMPPQGYGSDIHLFMDKDGKTMHALNRHYHDTFRRIYIYSSVDGVNWINKHTMLESSDASFDFLSPSILLEKGLYSMFAVDMVKQINQNIFDEIDVYTTYDVRGTWTKVKTFKIPNLKSDERVWHLEIRKISSFFYLLLQTCSKSSPGTNGRLYLLKSTDLVNWETHETPISSMFDGFNKDVYKSSFLPYIDGEGFRFKVWYNVTGGAGNWDLGYIEIHSKKQKQSELNTNDLPLLFYDNFDRIGTDPISKATKGTWTTGANPVIRTENGIATNNLGGTDPVYTLINNPEYIVNFKMEEITFNDKLKQYGSAVLYVGAQQNNDFEGMFLGYASGKLAITVRKNSNNVKVIHLRTSIKKGDNFSFFVSNVKKIIKCYINGELFYTYNNDDGLFASNANRVGFKYGSVGGILSVQEVSIFGVGSGIFRQTPPVSTTSYGNKGDYAADATYLYICHADSSWIRVVKDSTWT